MSPRPQRTTACAAAQLSTPPVYRRLCEDFSARSEQLVQVREDTQTLLCESSSQAFIKAAGACEAKLDQQLQATREPWPVIPAAGLGDWKLNTNAARDAIFALNFDLGDLRAQTQHGGAGSSGAQEQTPTSEDMAETRQESHAPFAHATAGQSHAQALGGRPHNDHRNADLHLEPEYRQPPRPSGAFPMGNEMPQEMPQEDENRPHPVARPVSRASSAPGGERGLLNRRKNHMGWLTAQSSQAARPPRCSQTQHTRRADASDIRPPLGQSRAGFGLPGFGGRPHSRDCERRPRPVRPHTTPPARRRRRRRR